MAGVNESELFEGASDSAPSALKILCYDRSETHISIRFEPRLLRGTPPIDGSLLARLAEAVTLVSHGCAYMYGHHASERESALEALRRGEIEISINPQSLKYSAARVEKACQTVITLLAES